jgi:hypothetical protein
MPTVNADNAYFKSSLNTVAFGLVTLAGGALFRALAMSLGTIAATNALPFLVAAGLVGMVTAIILGAVTTTQ